MKMSTFEKELDFNTLKRIGSKIKDITHRGTVHLNQSEVKEICNFCQIKDGYVEYTFSKIMTALGEKHSQVRLSAVLLCNELFIKFPHFRILLLDKKDVYLKLTFGEKFNQILPPPKKVASEVIKKSIYFIKQWHDQFTSVIEIKDLYNYLLQNNVDFDNLEIYDPVIRRKREKDLELSATLNKGLLNNMNRDMDNLYPEILTCIKTLESCFEMLVPSNDFLIGTDLNHCKVESGSNSKDCLRASGILNRNHTIEVPFANEKVVIVENNENQDILSCAKEMFKIIQNKYLPKTQAWLVLISKNDSSSSLYRNVNELEAKLYSCVQRFQLLDIKVPSSMEESDDTSDSDFEEVEELPVLPSKARDTEENQNEICLFEIKEKEELPKKLQLRTDNMHGRKKELLELAPKIPYDVDLYHWEDGKLPTQTIIPTSIEGHRFWASSSVESLEIPSEILTNRVIEFSGKFIPVERPCSAPLPSGKLCPRFDRVKCPLHGLIVPRDEKGKIINPEDECKVKKSIKKEDVPEWQNPKLLAEIKAATGVDLKITRKAKKKKKYPGLIDLNKNGTGHSRLSKKVFNKSSLKRIAKKLDNIDYRRHRDKYGDQFNYINNTS